MTSPLITGQNPSGPAMITSPLITGQNPSGPAMMTSPLITGQNPSGPAMMTSPLITIQNPSGPSMISSPFIQSHNPQSISLINSPLITNPNPSGPSMLNSPLLTNTGSALTSFSPMPSGNVENTSILNNTFSPIIGLSISTPTIGTGTNIASPIVGTPLIVNNVATNANTLKQSVNTGNESPLLVMSNTNIQESNTGSGIFDSNPIITLSSFDEKKVINNATTSTALLSSPVIVNSNGVTAGVGTVSSIPKPTGSSKNLIQQSQKYKQPLPKSGK